MLVHVQSVEQHLTGLRLLLAGQRLEQRRLARARGAHHRQELVARQFEGDSVEQAELAVVDAERQVLADQFAPATDFDGAGAVGGDLDEGRPHAEGGGPGDQVALNALVAEQDAVA